MGNMEETLNKESVLEETLPEEILEKEVLKIKEKISRANLLEPILSSLGEGVIAADKDHRITYVNPVAEKILSIEAKEMLGKLIWECHCQPANVEELMEFAKEKPFITEMNYQDLVLKINVTYLQKDNETIGSVMVFSDVTQLKVMEEKIEKANRLVREKQSKLDLQLQLAQVIQKTLLPPVTYTDDKVTISTSFLQASEIGGDFYLVIPINDDKVTFCIGDVMGKGVPAAMVMTILVGIFSDLIKSDLSPAQIMNEANRKLIEHLEEICYATVFLASYEKSRHLLTYVCAGHDKPYIINQQDFEEVKLEESDVIIGVFESVRYNQHEYVMNKGDRLVLYTDGLIDAYNKNKEHFGQQRLYDGISKFKHVPLRKFNEEIIKEIQHFIKGTPQHDDMALVVLEVKN